jgi:hypothetical protein
MSALNVIRQRDRVTVITDGAVWDVNTGVLQGFPAKQATLPSMPAVLATRGAPLATPVFAQLLSCRFSDFDSMVAGIEDVIPKIHAQVKLMCRNGADEPIIFCGYSTARNRPAAIAFPGGAG